MHCIHYISRILTLISSICPNKYYILKPGYYLLKAEVYLELMFVNLGFGFKSGRCCFLESAGLLFLAEVLTSLLERLLIELLLQG